ncbi:MAG: phytoene desaturase family protein [Alicyclobacillaceae bacterium]|nr:phytoene desaturase family protein [Alicyclobacillaceae bacterium]MCY0896649.1 phytoene desaturase family protein [Alicyclobacillaceae bacterium]
MAQRKVVVIGGGLAGMSAAIRLAVDGYHVTVLEKNQRVGGKLNRVSGNGFTFDTGPSILTMPWVLENLFAAANRDIRDYMEIVRVEPQWRSFFEDGHTMDLEGDLPSLLSTISSLNPSDGAKFLQYLQYCGRMYELSRQSFYKKSLSGLPDLRKEHSLRELMEMDPLKTMNTVTEKYLTDPHLRQMFNFFVMYVGSSPYDAPAILSQLIYVQLGLGIFYVKGGMYQIAEGMLKLAGELSVDIHTDAKVEEILFTGNRATGVRLESGEVVSADILVCNREVIPAHQSLLAQHPDKDAVISKLSKFEPTVSGHVLLLGVDCQYEQLRHHNFFFSENPEREFRDMFHDRKPTEDPTVYLGVSSRSDPSQAPVGMDNLFVLTHVPPLAPTESFEARREWYRDLVLNKLERMGLKDLRSHIVFEHQFIPDDLHQLYGANGGSIYGVVTDRKKNGGFKIASRSSLLSNLYFVGGSVHPGGGVPMVTLCGQLTADLIGQQETPEIRKLDVSS